MEVVSGNEVFSVFRLYVWWNAQVVVNGFTKSNVFVRVRIVFHANSPCCAAVGISCHRPLLLACVRIWHTMVPRSRDTWEP